LEHHAQVLIGGEWRQRLPNWRDVAAVILVMGVFSLIGTAGHQLTGPWTAALRPAISLSPAALPLYSLRTTARMLLAMVASLIFTLPLKTVLLVTHNIEEAVLLCDRILILSSNPGRICAEIPVPLAHPRDRLSPEFRAIVDEIYSTLTLRSLESIGSHGQAHGGLALALPRASVNQMSGLLETLSAPPYAGHAELSKLAGTLVLEVDDLFPIAEALHILGFAELTGRSLKLTAAGRVFAQEATDDRKRLLREHLLRFVPLASHIHRVLAEREEHWAPHLRFKAELEDHLTPRDAERTLGAVIGWARYAELFGYDARSRRLKLGTG